MNESRKQFAEAFEELTGYELEDYPDQAYADTCWEFWRMSRAAIEIELPSLKQIDTGERYVWSDGVFNFKEDAIEAIRAAGIKVKE